MNAPIRVLCVDDEPLVLEGLDRTLGDDFEVVTATSGAAALDVLAGDAAFDVIVSDMRMPEMNGAQFLARARRLAPDIARVLLTGHSDAESARAAVNEGQIFRYLVKPCPSTELVGVIEAGARAHRRTLADRELLETTVTGSVKLLAEVLALAAPGCFRDTPAVTGMVEHMCARLDVHASWKFRAAAMLHGLGDVALPPELIAKRARGEALSPTERRDLDGAAEIGARLLSEIPRLGEVAEIVRRHRNTPPAELEHEADLGAAMIHVAREVLEDVSATRRVAQVARALAATHPPATRALLETLFDYQARRPTESLAALGVGELRPGMALEEDMVTRGGRVLFSKGNELTAPLLERIRQFHRTTPLVEPIKVRLAA